MKINKILAQLQGTYYALTDGNTKLDHLLQIENYKNNLELIVYGLHATSAKLIRTSYNEKINTIKENFLKVFKAIHSNYMCFTPELAIKVSEARDEIKLVHQGQTPLLGRQQIYARNIEKYGDKNGPSKYYKLKQLQSDPEVFAYKALVTDGNDLGLSGNGFSEIVTTWASTRDINVDSYYPEDLLEGVSIIKGFFDTEF